MASRLSAVAFDVVETLMPLEPLAARFERAGLPASALREWFTRLLAQGWVDVVRAQNPDVPNLYSWWSQRGQARKNDVGWRIDYVLCNAPLAARVRKAWIEKQAQLSDHAPVWVEFGAG